MKKTLKQKTLNAVIIPMVSMNLAGSPMTTIETIKDTLNKTNANFKYKKEMLIKRERQMQYVDSELARMEASGINFEDVRLPSNLTLDEIEHLLDGTGLYSCSQDYLDAEELYGVNTLLLISITALESGWGNSRLAKEKNNLSGFMAYNIETFENAKTFSSKRESILKTAELLSVNYLNKDGRYYNGTSVECINKRYCTLDDGKTPDREWAKNVRQVARGLVRNLREYQKEVSVTLISTI